MVKTDITQMTAQEIKDYLQQKEAEAAKQLQQNAAKWKEELEAHCQKKYGVSLATIFTATTKPRDVRQFKYPDNHPKGGQIYTYSGRGKVPTCFMKDGKINTDYEVKSN